MPFGISVAIPFRKLFGRVVEVVLEAIFGEYFYEFTPKPINIVTANPTFSPTALKFNGTNYVNATGDLSNLLSYSEGSISVWIKPVDATSSLQVILSFMMNSSNRIEFAIEATGEIRMFASNAAGSQRFFYRSPGSLILNNTWTHIGITQDEDIEMYINGVHVAKTAVSSTNQQNYWWNDAPATSKVYIGGRDIGSGATSFFTGEMDELALFNRELSSEEMAGLYSLGLGEAAVDAFRYYKLNGTAGDMFAVDEGSDKAHGNLISFTTSPWKPQAIINEPDNAVTFDGTQYVTIDDIATTNDITVSFWARLNVDDDGTTNGYFLSGTTDGTTGTFIGLAMSQGFAGTGGYGKIFIYDGSISQLHTVPNPKEWFNVVMLLNGSTPTLTLYVNGVNVYSGAIGRDSVFNLIGASNLGGYSNFLKGNINSLSIKFNHTLTTDDAYQLYNNGYGKSPELVLGALDRHYKANEELLSPILIDSGSDGLDGTLVGYDTPYVYEPPFNISKGLDFTQGSDIVTFADIILTTTWNISLWFKPASAYGMIISDNSSAVNYIQIQNATSIRLRTGGDNAFAVPTITLNEWHHLHVSVDSGTSRVFFDGVESTTGAQTGEASISFNALGTFSGGGFYVNSVLAQIAIEVGVAGSLARAQAIYNNGKGIADISTVLTTANRIYNCDEANLSTTLVDSGTDLENGTLVGFPTSGLIRPVPLVAEENIGLHSTGVSEYVDYPILSVATCTISVWARANTNTNYIVSSTGATTSYISLAASTNLIYVRRGSNNYTTSTPLNLGEYYHIMVVLTATNIVIYLNGVLLESIVASGSFTIERGFRLWNTSNYYEGDTKSLLIKNAHEATAQNAADIYDLGLSGDASTIIASPTRHYALDTENGLVATDTGTDLADGTLTGFTLGEVRKPQPTISKDGNALTFNGSTQYVDTYAAIPTVNPMTTGSVIAWVKLVLNASGQPAALTQIYCISDLSGNPRIELAIDTNGYVRGYCNVSTQSWMLRGTTAPLVNNTWHHIAMVHDGSAAGAILYVDGVVIPQGFVGAEIDKADWMSSLTGVDSSKIGARTTGGNTNSFLDGEIAELIITSEAVSSGNLVSLYNEGYGVVATTVLTDPEIYYTFNDATDSATLEDFGTALKHGELFGFTLPEMWTDNSQPTSTPAIVGAVGDTTITTNYLASTGATTTNYFSSDLVSPSSSTNVGKYVVRFFLVVAIPQEGTGNTLLSDKTATQYHRIFLGNATGNTESITLKGSGTQVFSFAAGTIPIGDNVIVIEWTGASYTCSLNGGTPVAAVMTGTAAIDVIGTSESFYIMRRSAGSASLQEYGYVKSIDIYDDSDVLFFSFLNTYGSNGSSYAYGSNTFTRTVGDYTYEIINNNINKLRVEDTGTGGYDYHMAQKTGVAAEFDGSSSYITCSDIDAFSIIPNSFIYAVVTIDSLANDQIFAWGLASGGLAYGATTSIGGTSSKFGFHILDGTWKAAVADDVTPVLGETYFLLGYHTGTEIKIYVNGVEEGSLATTAAPVAVGSKVSYHLTYIPTCRISDVLKVNSDVTPLQILQIMNKPEFTKDDLVTWGIDFPSIKAWYPLTEGTGTTVYDHSDNANDGTFTNPAWVDGQDSIRQLGLMNVNKYPYFDGVDDYATVSGSSSLDFGLNDISFVWRGFSYEDGTNQKTIFDRSNGAGERISLYYYAHATRALTFRLESNVKVGYIATTVDIPEDGNLHTVIGTVDRDSVTGIKLYLDGVEKTTDSGLESALDTTAFTSDPLDIGDASEMWLFERDSNHGSGGAHANGTLKDLAFYDRLLTGGEISAITTSSTLPDTPTFHLDMTKIVGNAGVAEIGGNTVTIFNGNKGSLIYPEKTNGLDVFGIDTNHKNEITDGGEAIMNLVGTGGATFETNAAIVYTGIKFIQFMINCKDQDNISYVLSDDTGVIVSVVSNTITSYLGTDSIYVNDVETAIVLPDWKDGTGALYMQLVTIEFTTAQTFTEVHIGMDGHRADNSSEFLIDKLSFIKE